MNLTYKNLIAQLSGVLDSHDDYLPPDVRNKCEQITLILSHWMLLTLHMHSDILETISIERINVVNEEHVYYIKDTVVPLWCICI